MTTHSTTRRTLSSLAAAGLLALTAATPALAGTAPAVNLPEPIGDEPWPVQVVQPAQSAADDHLEYLQIGLGVLGGVAVTALAASAATAARHHRPHGHAVA